MVCLVLSRFRGWTAHLHIEIHGPTLGKRESPTEKGDKRAACNNAGLEKLKKRARRAAITSDVSRPNDRHLSRRSRCYAKSPLPFGDSARAASESYKQTASLRFSFPVLPLSLCRVALATIELQHVVTYGENKVNLRPTNLWIFENFSYARGNLWPVHSGEIIIAHSASKIWNYVNSWLLLKYMCWL